MAKRQTRRTISLSLAIYQYVMETARTAGISGAQLVEDALRSFLSGVPEATWMAQRQRGTLPAQPEPVRVVEPVRVPDRAELDVGRAKRALMVPAREVTIPCRRERCPWTHLHQEGSCL